MRTWIPLLLVACAEDIEPGASLPFDAVGPETAGCSDCYFDVSESLLYLEAPGGFPALSSATLHLQRPDGNTSWGLSPVPSGTSGTWSVPSSMSSGATAAGVVAVPVAGDTLLVEVPVVP